MAASTRSKLFIPDDCPKSAHQLFRLAKRQLLEEGYLLLPNVPVDHGLPLIEGLDSDSDIGEGKYRYGISWSWTTNANTEQDHAGTTTRKEHSSLLYQLDYIIVFSWLSRISSRIWSPTIFSHWTNSGDSRPRSGLVSLLPVYHSKPYILITDM
jgi:hypothetical protein